MIQDPRCLNCEAKKKTTYPTTIGESSGFICEECYNLHIWATEQGSDPYLIQKVNYIYGEDSRNLIQKLELE